jgi:hypothetical protein
MSTYKEKSNFFNLLFFENNKEIISKRCTKARVSAGGPQPKNISILGALWPCKYAAHARSRGASEHRKSSWLAQGQAKMSLTAFAEALMRIIDLL